MSPYRDLLFLHGHVADPDLATALATSPALPSRRSQGPATAPQRPHQWREPMNLFKSLLYLGGLESMDSRIGEEEEAYGHTYGNRIASEHVFGKRAAARRPQATASRRDVQAGAEDRLGCVAGGCG
jgi:hypothetical protein